jgi:hypothetical protein
LLLNTTRLSPLAIDRAVWVLRVFGASWFTILVAVDVAGLVADQQRVALEFGAGVLQLHDEIGAHQAATFDDGELFAAACAVLADLESIHMGELRVRRKHPVMFDVRIGGEADLRDRVAQCRVGSSSLVPLDDRGGAARRRLDDHARVGHTLVRGMGRRMHDQQRSRDARADLDVQAVGEQGRIEQRPALHIGVRGLREVGRDQSGIVAHLLPYARDLQAGDRTARAVGRAGGDHGRHFDEALRREHAQIIAWPPTARSEPDAAPRSCEEPPWTQS